MSILDRLSNEIPKRNKASTASPFYKITKQYLNEITRAKELGYSWAQIYTAIKEEMGAEWRVGWGLGALIKHYGQILKEENTNG